MLSKGVAWAQAHRAQVTDFKGEKQDRKRTKHDEQADPHIQGFTLHPVSSSRKHERGQQKIQPQHHQ